jgi:hypothetical protein
MGFNSAFKGLIASGLTLERCGSNVVSRGRETTTNNTATTTLQG